MRPWLLMLTLACALGGCTASNDPTPATPKAVATARSATAASAAPAVDHFASNAYGFSIDYPANMHVSRNFASSYLANGAWKSYAGPKSIGTPVLGLTIAHSNKITAGELRIGVSEDAAQVRQCTQPPTSLHDGSLDVISLNGIPFTHFAASDAAMSHYLLVHAYRAVHGGRCYAIDLLVIGTQPQVYDPPATPPFSHAQAFAQLHTALQSFRFTPTP